MRRGQHPAPMPNLPRIASVCAVSLVLGLVIAGCVDRNAVGADSDIPADRVDRIKGAYAKCIADDEFGSFSFVYCEKAMAMMAAAEFDAAHGTDVFDTPPVAPEAPDFEGGTSGAIKKFPQVTLKDDAADGSLASAASDSLAILEHRGGDPIVWSSYRVTVFENGVEAPLLFDDNEGCTSPSAAPSGGLNVGQKLWICDSATHDFDPNGELKVRIIDIDQNTIVYENTIMVS